MLSQRGMLLTFALTTLGQRTAYADDDGAYGRLNGDVSLRVAAGGATDFETVGPSAQLSALYLDTAGAYASFQHIPGEGSPTSSIGVEIAPLFLARFAKDLEQGPAWVDLWLDSFAVQLGTRLNPKSQQSSLELGLEMSIPFMSDAQGLFLAVRSVAIWSEFRHTEAPSPGAFAMISWREPLRTHLVDAFDSLPH